MSLEYKEQLKEQAYDDCVKYGTPTMGIDHSNHYKTMTELMEIVRKIDMTEKPND